MPRVSQELLDGKPLSANVPSMSRLEYIRKLRLRVANLLTNLVGDLQPFLNKDKKTFRRLPTSEATDTPSLTTTCSSLMALALAKKTSKLWCSAPSIYEAFASVFNAERWQSSSLEHLNAFTSSIILRAAGILYSQGEVSRDELENLEGHVGKIADRVQQIARALPQSLAVGSYEPSPVIGFWYLDAVAKLEIRLPKKQWLQLAKWLCNEFRANFSLVAADHDSLKDPVAMAMAASACSLLRTLALAKAGGVPENLLHLLPSPIELHTAIRHLFRLQEATGTWPKYFPLFHYPDAGANYCFAFELLEAILEAFASSEEGILCEQTILAGLESAVSWCETHRLAYSFDGTIYCGWNSGGQAEILRKGLPESWATSTVYMFLVRFSALLEAEIKATTLQRYGADPKKKNNHGWAAFIDLDVRLPSGEIHGIKRIVESHVIRLIEERKGDSSLLGQRRSALLFGPPGTSKTSFVKAIAHRIGWPLVELNPSDFLSAGLEKIYSRATEIFTELLELSRVVVLFDEMDALVQSREGATGQQLDITRQFLTTSMLPKLAKLHSQARNLFFMATNHRASFDPAIMRPGRFDLLLCMGPPTWKQKLERLESFINSDEIDILLIKETLRRWITKMTHWCTCWIDSHLVNLAHS